MLEPKENHLAKLEAGQRGLPLDEAFLFAFALDVAPINLFLPLEEEEDVQIAARTVASSATLRDWVVGGHPLGGPDGGQNPRHYYSEVPERLFLERIGAEQFKRELADAHRKVDG